jgi:hypothetical protein
VKQYQEILETKVTIFFLLLKNFFDHFVDGFQLELDAEIGVYRNLLEGERTR